MNINCLVVDDDKGFGLVISRYVKKTDFLNLVDTCTSAIEAANIMRKQKIDLLFLDIEMPEMNGLELLDTLSHPPEVILITSKENYAVESYNYNVLDYLLKPAEYPRFLIAANKAKEKISQDKDFEIIQDHIFVKSNSKLVKILLNDILFIEALKDYICIVTETEKYIVYSTMKKIESKLSSKQFARIHRSYIVNINFITDLTDNNLTLGKKVLPIGASYKENLKRAINIL